MVDGAGHDNTRAPSEELLGCDCGQSQVSKARTTPSTREEMLEMALLMYVTAHEHLLVAEGFESEGARRMTRRYRIAREALES